MMQLKSLDIAIIGNQDQTALMRLAGIKKYAIIDADVHDFKDKLKDAVNNFSQDATVGIIMIPDDWIGFVDDLVRQIRQSKRISTIIVEFPSKFELEKKNVKEYYKTFTKNQIGFNIEI